MGKQVVARLYGGVAQLGEHLPCKQGVMSSNLTVSIGVETLKCTLKTSYRDKLLINKFFIDQDIRETNQKYLFFEYNTSSKGSRKTANQKL